MNIPPAHSNMETDRSKADWVAPELVPLDVGLDAVRLGLGGSGDLIIPLSAS
jgi:hypothetical protein